MDNIFVQQTLNDLLLCARPWESADDIPALAQLIFQGDM